MLEHIAQEILTSTFHIACSILTHCKQEASVRTQASVPGMPREKTYFLSNPPGSTVQCSITHISVLSRLVDSTGGGRRFAVFGEPTKSVTVSCPSLFCLLELPCSVVNTSSGFFRLQTHCRIHFSVKLQRGGKEDQHIEIRYAQPSGDIIVVI